MSDSNRSRRFDGRRQWDDEDRGSRRDQGRPRDNRGGDRRERDDRDRRRDGDDRDHRRRYRSRSRERRDNQHRSRSRERERPRDDDRDFGRAKDRDDRGKGRDRRDRGEPRDGGRPGRHRDEEPPHREKGTSWTRQLAFHGRAVAMDFDFTRTRLENGADIAPQDRHAERRRSASPGRSESPRREHLPTRSKGVERPGAVHPHVTTSIKVGGGHDGERDRPGEREQSYGEEDSRNRDDTDGREQGEAMDEDEEELEVEDEGMAAMQAMMGFGGFGTTKGKKIAGNNVGAVRKEKKTEYRQYMNRVGGFNRPLSPGR